MQWKFSGFLHFCYFWDFRKLLREETLEGNLKPVNINGKVSKQ